MGSTRLGIPAIVHEECLNGFNSKDASIFPQIIGMASTWDPALMGEMVTVIRKQMSDGRHSTGPLARPGYSA